MNLTRYIALRYLFSKKKQNAINIISTISVIGVAVGTMALIVVMSVFNGIDLLLKSSVDSLTPDVVISPAEGKFAHFDSTVYRVLESNPEIDYYYPVVEENALLKYEERLKPVTVKGVPEKYNRLTGFSANIIQGKFELSSGDIYKAVIGYGVAAELQIGLKLLTPLQFYYPNKRTTSYSSPSALYTEYLYPAGFFSSQYEIDEKLVITDIAFARKLLRIGNQISKIEIRLKNEHKTEAVKKELIDNIDKRYLVEDKYDLNRSFYSMMQTEKLAIFVILIFILLIASFNIIGSISMLILDKKENLQTFKALGMPVKKIITVFKTEGNLITLFGALAGLVAGITLCLIQEKFGLLKLGDGTYVMEAYPVDIVASDVVLILLAVLLIGYIVSYFPVKYLVKKLIN